MKELWEDPDDVGALMFDLICRISAEQGLIEQCDVMRFDLPAPYVKRPGWIARNWTKLRRWLQKGDLPLYRELGPDNGKGYPEVAQALAGQSSSRVRVNDQGEVIVHVALRVLRGEVRVGSEHARPRTKARLLCERRVLAARERDNGLQTLRANELRMCIESAELHLAVPRSTCG